MKQAHNHDRANDGHDHGHDHGRDTALLEADAFCRARGQRLTAMRRQVLEALITSRRALGAYDLIDLVARPGEKRPAPITIYRALEFLIETGLSHRISSRNAFVACPHRHASDEVVVFMICDGCGAVAESTSEAVRESLAGLSLQQHFRPRTNIIELEGLCAACATRPVTA